MTLKYLAVNNIMKLTDSPYKTKDKHYKLHWKMKSGTDIYVHKPSEIFIWYIRLAVGTNISPGNARSAFFMGPHLTLGALNPYFHRYAISVCVHGNQTKCFPTIFVWAVWIFLTIFLFFLESLSELSKGASSFPSDVFFLCHLSRILLISHGCFHRRMSQDCYISFVSSSVCCSFPACTFRKRTDKFRSQGRAWGKICFGTCSFGRTYFGRMNSWRVWSCRLIMFNVSVTAVRCCSVCGWSWSVLHMRTEPPPTKISLL
jgi:hypothetical protein